jgi:hypothetical protein
MPLTKTVDGWVQSLFGGQYTLVQPTTTLIEKAKNCQYISDHLLYARVDGIIINSELHLMEIECIDPIYISISAKMHWNDLLNNSQINSNFVYLKNMINSYVWVNEQLKCLISHYWIILFL